MYDISIGYNEDLDYSIYSTSGTNMVLNDDIYYLLSDRYFIQKADETDESSSIYAEFMQRMKELEEGTSSNEQEWSDINDWFGRLGNDVDYPTTGQGTKEILSMASGDFSVPFKYNQDRSAIVVDYGLIGLIRNKVAYTGIHDVSSPANPLDWFVKYVYQYQNGKVYSKIYVFDASCMLRTIQFIENGEGIDLH